MDSRLSPYPGLRARHLHSSGREWWLTGQRVRVLGHRDQLLPEQGRRSTSPARSAWLTAY
jgi:hypothetical protein